MEIRQRDDIDRRQRLLDAWVERRRRIAMLEAECADLLAERMRVCDDDAREQPHHRESIHRSMIAEYAAAGRLAKGSVEFAFADACLLDSAHAAVRGAFVRGDITSAHVREIVRAGMIVREAVRKGRTDAATLGLYDTAALVVAETDSPARTRAVVRQIAASLAGETLVERHRRAHGDRAITMRSLDDGLALLQVVLPEHLACAVMDRLTRLARQVVATRDTLDPVLSADPLDAGADPIYASDLAPDDPRRDDPLLNAHVISGDAHVIFGYGDTFTLDPVLEPALEPALEPVLDPVLEPALEIEHIPADERTIDQVRADLFADLLLTADPSASGGTGLEGIQARIQVTVAANTLVGSDDRPAQLDGCGAIDPDIARDLAGRTGGWSRLFLDHAGMVTATDSYSPTEAMRRHLRARDQHCRFPGCRMPVHRCQIDHNHDHAKGGPTHLDNLCHLCPGHHVLKHPDVLERHRWTARQLAGGDIEWTSPLGRVYRDAVPRRVMFV
ncbi:DUF222 domain-containing protein [Microbacterium sp. 179-I 3D3 NHS]|uniref:HNH endonuclease signature motif containing protein n=1 Tax=Microbacterium sp. 179-I 3D3 NHS TaxID=3142382 RepID=UPI00399F08C6